MGLGSIFKSIGKVVKKASKYALPIAAAYFGSAAATGGLSSTAAQLSSSAGTISSSGSSIFGGLSNAWTSLSDTVSSAWGTVTKSVGDFFTPSTITSTSPATNMAETITPAPAPGGRLSESTKKTMGWLSLANTGIGLLQAKNNYNTMEESLDQSAALTEKRVQSIAADTKISVLDLRRKMTLQRAQMEAHYTASGVQLTGTPLLMLEEANRLGEEQIAAIQERGLRQIDETRYANVVGASRVKRKEANSLLDVGSTILTGINQALPYLSKPESSGNKGGSSNVNSSSNSGSGSGSGS